MQGALVAVVAVMGALTLGAGCSAQPPQPPAESTAKPLKAIDAGHVPGPASAGADIAGSAPVATAPPAPVTVPFRSAETFDIAIRNGDVIDGTGAPRRKADVLVRGDRIAHVGPVDASVHAKVELDATGAVVTPGFVDAHSHGNGNDDNAVAQGVTTVLIGQDGGSPTAGGLASWMASNDGKLRINVAALVGHASIRARAKAGVPASARDLEAMARLVDQAMKDGAFGLSMGLEYEPGRRADAAELTAIARPVARRSGVLMSHLRSEDEDAILASIDELVAQGKSAGARVHVSHIKVVGGRSEAAALPVLARLDAARSAGIEVTADWYPYTASYTGLEILFPDWMRGGGPAPANRREALRTHLRNRVLSRNGPEAMLFGAGTGHEGKTLAAVAKEHGVPFEDVLAEMGPSKGSAAYFVMNEALQDRLLADPHVMIGSDGAGHSSHPRGSGSFARVIETMVEKKHVLSLEEAVRRMTSLPMRTLRAEADRGSVTEGRVADLAVFAPSQIHERATFTDPNRQATGMRHVVVAGRVIWRQGVASSGRPGRMLRSAWAEGPDLEQANER